MNANEILKKHEDANEMHFHEVDRKWIIEAMEEYAALRQLPVSRRAWLFQGTNEQKFPITIYVSATDRESAIAHFETDYPQYNWWATVECPVLCG